MINQNNIEEEQLFFARQKIWNRCRQLMILSFVMGFIFGSLLISLLWKGFLCH